MVELPPELVGVPDVLCVKLGHVADLHRVEQPVACAGPAQVDLVAQERGGEAAAGLERLAVDTSLLELLKGRAVVPHDHAHPTAPGLPSHRLEQLLEALGIAMVWDQDA